MMMPAITCTVHFSNDYHQSETVLFTEEMSIIGVGSKLSLVHVHPGRDQELTVLSETMLPWQEPFHCTVHALF